MRIDVRDLCVTMAERPILDHVSLTAEEGTFRGVIGPNGSGKSTLLRAMYRATRPTSGSVHIGHKNVWTEMNVREVARTRAVVTQDTITDFDFTVADIVSMGRSPHLGILARESHKDRAVIQESLNMVDMNWARARRVSTLSGGERQRVYLARALAQSAPVLILDEPTNHLDIKAQLELLDLVRSLPLTVVAALHDLDHAVAYCDSVTVLSQGRVVADGSPVDVLTPDLVLEVFGVRASMQEHPLTGRPHIVVASRKSIHESEAS